MGGGAEKAAEMGQSGRERGVVDGGLVKKQQLSEDGHAGEKARQFITEGRPEVDHLPSPSGNFQGPVMTNNTGAET